jgi:alkyl hydroperoxide reductase subunit F
MKIHDLLILGAGPAGITAAVYSARRKMDILVITENIGGQTILSGDIENYPGYQFITGSELTLKFEKHMKSFGIKENIPESVVEIKKEEDGLIKTITNKGQYLSRTLIVATGKRSRPLGAQGEGEFKNRGVTYCATCDGPLFKGKNIAVIGGGNSGLEAVLQMLKISPKIYLVDIEPISRANPVMVEKAQQAPNVEIWNNSVVRKIYGDEFVKGIEIEQDGKMHKLDAEGVFVEIGLEPNSDCASILERNEWGEIKVDCHNRTSVEAIFAAGDVTDVPEKQIIVACGEGSKACLSAFKYLSTHKF